MQGNFTKFRLQPKLAGGFSHEGSTPPESNSVGGAKDFAQE